MRVAHPTFLGPLISVKDGKTTGLVADVLRAAAARAGFQIVFVPMSSGLNSSLRSGTVDAIAPMLIPPAAQNSYDFTDAFVVTGGGLFVRAPQAAPPAGSAYVAALNMEEGAATVAASYAGKISVPTAPFLQEPLGLAVAKGTHADLVRPLNHALAAMRSDGTLARIERAWRR